MSAKPLVIQTEQLSDRAHAWLSERVELVKAGPEDAVFKEAADRIQGLVVRTYTDVDEALLDRLPALQVVGRAGVGLDNIDLEACRKRGVEVVHTPEANTQAVVEFVFRMLLATIRPTLRLTEPVDAGAWGELRSECVGRREFDEMTFGILGLGKIGSRVASVARAFGARTLYNDHEEHAVLEPHGAEPVSPTELFERSDILTIHVDGRAANRELIGTDLLDRMPADSILINTSRGFVIQETALAAHLKKNPEALALLDVHAVEPIPADSPILPLPNARLSPHLASRTASAMERMSDVVEDVWSVLQGDSPRWAAPRD